MKALKTIIAVMCVAVVLLAFPFFSLAIGFDADEVYHSIFVVYSGDSVGSGFAIGENCIITNAHVIDNPNYVSIESYEAEYYDAAILAIDYDLDIAVLAVAAGSFKPLKAADIASVSDGDDVWAIGAPNNLSYTLTKGIVSSKTRYIGRQYYIQTDAAINPGNSGGPLLNDSGEVIGVNSYKYSDAEGIGLAIPIDMVEAFLQGKDLDIEDGHVSVIVTPGMPSPDAVIDDEPDTVPVKNRSGLIIGLILALIVSIVLNIVLIACLAEQKNKNARKPDPVTEEKDFEIEFFD